MNNGNKNQSRKSNDILKELNIMNDKLLRVIGVIIFVFFNAIFIQITFSYMFKMAIIFNVGIFETSREAYAFLMPLYFYLIIGFFPLALASIFTFFLNLNKTILFTSLSLFIIVPTMVIPLLVLPFNLISPYLSEFIMNFISPSIVFAILFLLIFFKLTPHYKKQAQVRKKVLSFSTNYSEFKIYDLAKIFSTDKDFIKSVVKKMIKNNEIYAEYFKNTKKFAFNIKSNLKEIDKLMALYEQWEIEHLGKQ